MDLLSLVGQVTKRKGDLFSQAENLARKSRNQGNLESRMEKEAKVLVKALRDGDIRWDEYSRALLDKTLVSALSAVYLGSLKSDPYSSMEKAWPTVVGEMAPPLKNFLDQTERDIKNGILMMGDTAFDFADEEPYEDVYYPEEEPPVEEPKRRTTWMGVYSRVKRYIASPTHSFYSLGENLLRSKQGFKEMRRIARNDLRTCSDCRRYESLGWQPFGSLPMPGKQCRCFDRCRCFIEYR